MPRAIATGICGLVLTAAATAAADEGLVGHWSFDRAGNRIADHSGRGHDAILAGEKPKGDKEQSLVRLDGGQTITVPSVADLNLKKGFTIETRFRLADLKDGRIIVFKDQEYQLRVDWGKEGNKLSFFVYVGGQWESRVTRLHPDARPLVPCGRDLGWAKGNALG